LAQLPNRRIATQYAVSEQAIRRHRIDHLPSKLADAEAVSRGVEAVDLLAELKALRSKAMSLLNQAERAGDIRSALAGIREVRSTLELYAEIQGELDRRPTLNILAVSPEWLTVRASLMVSLGPYPEARRAVADGLMALEAGS
jgi:hypothetical protein